MEFDKKQHKLGLEVVEGGHLSNGFAKYATHFKLTAAQDGRRTLVEVAVECELASEEAVPEEADLKAKTTNFPLLFFECLEAYLNKEAAKA